MPFSSLYRNIAVSALVALTFGASTGAAQEKTGKARIGFLAFASPTGDCQNKAFTEGLQELGYVVGENVVLECQHASGHQEIDAAAKELVRRRPDVIVAFGHAPALAVRRATRDIPIVMSTSGEPVSAGLIASLARPGGNVTGVSYYNTELNAKRLELIKAVVPGLKRIALIRDPNAPQDLIDVYGRHSSEAARTLALLTSKM